MAKKYKKKFERDYQFYFDNRHKFSLAGCLVPSVPYDKDGVDAKRAFWWFDSQGRLPPCREPELFKELLTCKKSINMHIKMWAEGQFDCMIPINDSSDYKWEVGLMSEFIDPPGWVEEALRNQIEKEYRKRRR